MNQFDVLNGKEPTDTPKEWNNQPTAAYFKPSTYPPKTGTVVSDIMGRLNHHVIDNGDIDVHPSGFPFESNSEFVTDTKTNMNKSIDDDEMYHLLEFFH